MTDIPDEAPVTWMQAFEAEILPVEFLNWLAQTHGVPEGNIKRVDYERYKAEYEKANGL